MKSYEQVKREMRQVINKKLKGASFILLDAVLRLINHCNNDKKSDIILKSKKKKGMTDSQATRWALDHIS